MIARFDAAAPFCRSAPTPRFSWSRGRRPRGDLRGGRGDPDQKALRHSRAFPKPSSWTAARRCADSVGESGPDETPALTRTGLEALPWWLYAAWTRPDFAAGNRFWPDALGRLRPPGSDLLFASSCVSGAGGWARDGAVRRGFGSGPVDEALRGSRRHRSHVPPPALSGAGDGVPARTRSPVLAGLGWRRSRGPAGGSGRAPGRDRPLSRRDRPGQEREQAAAERSRRAAERQAARRGESRAAGRERRAEEREQAVRRIVSSRPQGREQAVTQERQAAPPGRVGRRRSGQAGAGAGAGRAAGAGAGRPQVHRGFVGGAGLSPNRLTGELWRPLASPARPCGHGRGRGGLRHSPWRAAALSPGLGCSGFRWCGFAGAAPERPLAERPCPERPWRSALADRPWPAALPERLQRHPRYVLVAALAGPPYDGRPWPPGGLARSLAVAAGAFAYPPPRAVLAAPLAAFSGLVSALAAEGRPRASITICGGVEGAQGVFGVGEFARRRGRSVPRDRETDIAKALPLKVENGVCSIGPHPRTLSLPLSGSTWPGALFIARAASAADALPPGRRARAVRQRCLVGGGRRAARLPRPPPMVDPPCGCLRR